ncbi:hypothetical protein FEP63_00848 [Burkholderia multivorans]|nr:hypothetical protein [Burkholderia multivorans]MDR8879345.1 hypothetical protein [Burkholderia multivorans]MDR8885209.1 hypothetical protein [Burkholderia multivorans]MDR8891149.1 hypothetical protein [Burkholderia multivorans]MDR8898088.1 hypothetical protein [Burkholderia multivorans]
MFASFAPSPIQSIPFVIEHTFYNVRIIASWANHHGIVTIGISISHHELDPIARQKYRPHAPRSASVILRNSNILGLVPITQSLAVHLLVGLPSHRQPQVRLPFSRVARAASFRPSSRGTTTVTHRHNIRPTPANTRSLRPRNRKRVDVPRGVIQCPRTAAAQLDTFRRLDLRRLICRQVSTSREKCQEHHNEPTQSICFHSSSVSILFAPSMTGIGASFEGMTS